jgi:hypothetical protein
MMSRREAVRRGRAFWVKLVGQWRRSGQSQREFSEARGVSVCTLQYWVYKLRDESAGSDLRATKPAFVEVRQASLGGLGQVHRLRLGERVVLELTELPPAAWLRELC